MRRGNESDLTFGSARSVPLNNRTALDGDIGRSPVFPAWSGLSAGDGIVFMMSVIQSVCKVRHVFLSSALASFHPPCMAISHFDDGILDCLHCLNIALPYD